MGKGWPKRESKRNLNITLKPSVSLFIGSWFNCQIVSSGRTTPFTLAHIKTFFVQCNQVSSIKKLLLCFPFSHVNWNLQIAFMVYSFLFKKTNFFHRYWAQQLLLLPFLGSKLFVSNLSETISISQMKSSQGMYAMTVCELVTPEFNPWLSEVASKNIIYRKVSLRLLWPLSGRRTRAICTFQPEWAGNNLPKRNHTKGAPEESCTIHVLNADKSHTFQGAKNSNKMKCE